jgi:hypothetical protein
MYVNRGGKLKPEYLPAIYFDSSVLIDYWIIEGSEIDLPEDPTLKIIEQNEPNYVTVCRELFRADKRIQKVTEIRKILLMGTPRLSVVISPLCLLELMEWNAESAFKEFASESASTMFIQRKSKKEIGNYLKKLLELRSKEVKEQKGERKGCSTGLEIMMGETWLNRGFTECHGLRGLLQADIVNFKLEIDKSWSEPSAYAYLQLGVSDILHILFAQHLGCSYIASFDEDFRRVSDIVEEENNMKVLSTPESILNLLR